jgi:hypothetical protein
VRGSARPARLQACAGCTAQWGARRGGDEHARTW